MAGDIYRLNIKNANSTYDTYNIRDSRFDSLSTKYATMNAELHEAVDDIQEMAASRGEYVLYEIKADGWTEGADSIPSNAHYSFEVAHGGQQAYPAVEYDILIEPSPYIAGDEGHPNLVAYRAWCEAKVVGSHTPANVNGQITAKNMITALGIVPTVDIPVMLRVEKRL